MDHRYKMGTCCVAVGCTMRSRTNLLSKIKMISFPSDPARCRLWELAVCRKDWKATKSSRICSRHFITGRPSTDPLHPDYVPSVFEHTNKKQIVLAIKRYVNTVKRNHLKESKMYKNNEETHKKSRSEDSVSKDVKKPVIISFIGATKRSEETNFDNTLSEIENEDLPAVEEMEDTEVQLEDPDESFGQFIVGLLKTIPESTEKDSLRVRFMEDLMKYKISLLDQS